MTARKSPPQTGAVSAKKGTTASRKAAPAKTAAKQPVAKAKTVRKTAAAKPAVKQPVAKAQPVRKTAAAKPAVKQPVAKAQPVRKTAAAKPAVKQPVAKAKPVRETTAAKPAPKPAPQAAIPAKPAKSAPKPKAQTPRAFSEAELKRLYTDMLNLRSRLTTQVAELREQSLLRHDEVNQDEDGTDAFERVTSLDRASVDQSQINEINTAIEMINAGTYGLCEHCGGKIEKPRLHALPFAKACMRCKSTLESDRYSRRKPSVDLLD